MIQIIPTQLLCLRDGLDGHDDLLYCQGEIYDIVKIDKVVYVARPCIDEENDAFVDSLTINVPIGHQDFLVVYEKEGEENIEKIKS